jgi:hypothetical protein
VGPIRSHADVTVTSSWSSPSFPLSLASPALKRRGVPPWRRRDALRVPPLHLGRPRAPRRASPIRSRHCRLQGLPTLATSGDSSPVHTTTRRRRRRGRGEEERRPPEEAPPAAKPGAFREEEPDPRKPSTPVTPCFLVFLCSEPVVTVSRISSLTPSPPGPPWKIGEHHTPLPFCGAWSSRQGRSRPGVP